MSLMHALALSDATGTAQEAYAAVKQLATEVADAEQAFTDLGEALEARAKELEQQFPAYAGLFTDAALALTRLQQQLDEVQQQEQAARAAAETDRAAEAFDPDAVQLSKRERPQGNIKQLFKRLAQLCHPDRTDDTYLHGLFEQAQQAREAHDRALIQDLLLEAELHLAGTGEGPGRKIPDLLERLMSRHQYLTQQLRLWESRLRILRQTPMGQVYVMSSSDRPAVREQGLSLFKTQLLKRISELESKATQLRQELLARQQQPVV